LQAIRFGKVPSLHDGHAQQTKVSGRNDVIGGNDFLIGGNPIPSRYDRWTEISPVFIERQGIGRGDILHVGKCAHAINDPAEEFDAVLIVEIGDASRQDTLRIESQIHTQHIVEARLEQQRRYQQHKNQRELCPNKPEMNLPDGVARSAGAALVCGNRTRANRQRVTQRG